jgi:trehalose synthase
VREIEPRPLSLDALASVLDPPRFDAFTDTMKSASSRLLGRTLWHINSTSEGGGVAEILHSVLGYVSAFGIDVRWAVIDADEGFFTLTKRIHNMLHGADGIELTDDDRALYERALDANADGGPRAGDIVVLHDPQTVGLAHAFRKRGCDVLWSCHIGADEPNVAVKMAWDFLVPHALATQAQVFSRRAYAWEGLADEQIEIIPPCIDPCATKNMTLDDAAVRGVLDVISRSAEVIESAACDPVAPLVVQVSRWDGLKDPIGVMRGSIDHVDAQLMLAGPALGSVKDDPESWEVVEQVRAEWETLPDAARARVHIACLPMDDVDENARIVNALQRRADVVVQKSLAEGFGLTVAEAMWKGRPVVGSRVGGIQDQIEDGTSGLLVEPDDLAAFGAAVTRLLDDRALAQKIGARARERATDEYITDCYLGRWMELIQRVA